MRDRAGDEITKTSEMATVTGHLAPIDLVASEGKEIQLPCARTEFDALENADETQRLGGAPGHWDYEEDQMLVLPYYGPAPGGLGNTGIGDMDGMAPRPHVYTFDRVPVGEVEVRRGDHVRMDRLAGPGSVRPLRSPSRAALGLRRQRLRRVWGRRRDR
jgi:hypothetical protein